MESTESFKGLFAQDATFADPATTTPTADLASISRNTRNIFPDWSQEITSIRGGANWAVFEWIGRATYTPRGETYGAGAQIEIHGATIIEVNDHGLVTRWRDYLDRKEPEDQIRRQVGLSQHKVTEST